MTLTDSIAVSPAMHPCCPCSFGFSNYLQSSCFATIPVDIRPISQRKLHLQLLVWITVTWRYVALLLCCVSFLVRNMCSRTVSLQISFCAMCRVLLSDTSIWEVAFTCIKYVVFGKLTSIHFIMSDALSISFMVVEHAITIDECEERFLFVFCFVLLWSKIS